MENKLHPLQKLDGCFNTRSRVKFNLFEPTPEMIMNGDISHALAFNPHFNGHSPQFFSIAQHCLLVVELVEKECNDVELSLMALMHDAAEAYIGDMIKPLKVHFPEFSKIEERIMKAIAGKFSLNLALMPSVKPFDIKAQQLEYEQFYKGVNHFRYMLPNEAESNFTLKFYELLNKRIEP